MGDYTSAAVEQGLSESEPQPHYFLLDISKPNIKVQSSISHLLVSKFLTIKFTAGRFTSCNFHK